MRKLIFFILMGGMSFIACKKVKGPASVRSAQPDNSVDSLVTIKMSINGVAWSTDSVYSYKVENSSNDSGVYNFMVIATRAKDGKVSTLNINLTGYSGLKDYPVNPPINTITYYADNHRYYATSGSVNIQSDSNKVLSGTFNFIADSIVASKGAFKLAIP
jgi:hypothetical protein